MLDHNTVHFGIVAFSHRWGVVASVGQARHAQWVTQSLPTVVPEKGIPFSGHTSGVSFQVGSLRPNAVVGHEYSITFTNQILVFIRDK